MASHEDKQIKEMLRFRDALSAAHALAAKERDGWYNVVDGPAGEELAWMGRERTMLLAMVNDRRHTLGAGTVTANQVYEVEESAAGHVDYADKLALRLAFLTYGLEWKP
jgi:hypothetical protein